MEREGNMRFLIIEDDDCKAKKVSDCLDDHEVVRAKSYNSGVRKLMQDQFDGVILDMGLPIFDDGSGLKSDRGIMVLMEMSRKNIITPVLVHSWSKFDVSEFQNVLDYIVAGFYNIRDQVGAFVKAVEIQSADHLVESS
ncbi:hypothetical protein ACFVS2_25800 [Brevibacillus sp. NPDC058079]|uniref:hypothetical protein n=1 Tax=Brevibacillus sp. NPDC058079 TaxID=3346330 RepID=UPI0036EDE017